MRSDLGLHAADVLKRVKIIRDPTECPGVLRSLRYLNFRTSVLYMLRAVAEQLSCFVTELAMKTTLANAEAALDEVQRDAHKLRSQELREVIEKCIEEQRQQIKALRRMMN